MRAFVIGMFRRAACAVDMGTRLKSIINIRLICAPHEVKLLLALVDSNALTLMMSCYLFLANQHTLKPALIF